MYWLSIPLWYFIFGISIDLSFKAVKWLKDNHRGVCAGGVFIILSFFTIGCSAVVYYYSDFHRNVHRLRYGEGYEQVTWGDFYASDVFEQIDEYIVEDKKSTERCHLEFILRQHYIMDFIVLMAIPIIIL